MTEKSLQDLLLPDLKDDLALVHTLMDRIESRGQALAAGVSILLSAISISVTANTQIAATIRDNGLLVVLGVLAYGLLLASLFFAIRVAAPRRLSVTPADTYEVLSVEQATTQVSSDRFEELEKELDTATNKLLHAQYGELLAALESRGSMLSIGHYAFVGAVAVLTLIAGIVTFC